MRALKSHAASVNIIVCQQMLMEMINNPLIISANGSKK